MNQTAELVQAADHAAAIADQLNRTQDPQTAIALAIQCNAIARAASAFAGQTEVA